MNVYSSLEDMPELKEGQIECLELNEEQISVTFKICKGNRCVGCAFDDMPANFCRNAKCSVADRSDRKNGIYVVVNREKMGLQITEANWDFVEENITELGRQYDERQAILRACIDEGKILDRGRLMEYYRSLAMVYIDAVNNFTKQQHENDN